MDFNQLKTLLNDKQVPVTYEWLTEMRQRYPYFTLPALLYLERNGMQGNEQLLDDSMECGHRSFTIMGGAFEGTQVESRMLTHEATFGVGYGICIYHPQAKEVH